jgi:hypothetical protein
MANQEHLEILTQEVESISQRVVRTVCSSIDRPFPTPSVIIVDSDPDIYLLVNLALLNSFREVYEP